MSATRKSRVGTATRILDAAERLVQVRGFNAFSYADISAALGIQKASLHHHFGTKADLGLALLARYRQRFGKALAEIESSEKSAFERLVGFAGLYRSVLRRKRMCLCGMLATDAATLPKAMRDSVAEFFTESEAWLSRALAEGREAGELEFDGAPGPVAAFIISSLEGAMLVARLRDSVGYFDDVARQTLADLRVRGATAKRSRTSCP